MSLLRRAANARETCPPARGSGVTLRSLVVLVVGVDDDTAWACREAAAADDVGFVRVAQGIAAGRAIRECRPTIVGIGPSLWSDERRAIAEAANEARARVVEMPVVTPRVHVARALVRAALSGERHERAAG